MATPPDRARPARAPQPLPPPTRFAAWIVTGPMGHLYGGVADWATLLSRFMWARVRGRPPETVTLDRGPTR